MWWYHFSCITREFSEIIHHFLTGRYRLWCPWKGHHLHRRGPLRLSHLHHSHHPSELPENCRGKLHRPVSGSGHGQPELGYGNFAAGAVGTVVGFCFVLVLMNLFLEMMLLFSHSVMSDSATVWKGKRWCWVPWSEEEYRDAVTQAFRTREDCQTFHIIMTSATQSLKTL